MTYRRSQRKGAKLAKPRSERRAFLALYRLSRRHSLDLSLLVVGRKILRPTPPNPVSSRQPSCRLVVRRTEGTFRRTSPRRWTRRERSKTKQRTDSVSPLAAKRHFNTGTRRNDGVEPFERLLGEAGNGVKVHEVPVPWRLAVGAASRHSSWPLFRATEDALLHVPPMHTDRAPFERRGAGGRRARAKLGQSRVDSAKTTLPSKTLPRKHCFQNIGSDE